MTKYTEWVAPIFIVLAIVVVWLLLTYLPLASFGVNIPTTDLWLYMPWLIAFAVGLYVLKEVYRKR